MYEVILTPNMAAKTFSGTVDISFTALATGDLDKIVLHSSGLDFTVSHRHGDHREDAVNALPLITMSVHR